MCHYTLPLRSDFNGMGLVSLHHTLIVMKGSMKMPFFLLPKLNGIHTIPLYNRWQCHLFYYPSRMRFVLVHHTLTIIEGNYNNATFLVLPRWNWTHAIESNSNIHWHKWKATMVMPLSWILKWNVSGCVHHWFCKFLKGL